MTASNQDWIAADWPAAPHVHAGTSLRNGGVSQGNYASLNLAAHVGDDAAAVATNRQAFGDRHALPSTPVWLEQVHGDRVIELDEKTPDVMQTDGSVTRQRYTVCAVLTADCVPVILSDKQGTRVAAIHAGWRGTCKGIIDRAIDCFPEPDQLLVWIGPCISKDYYEVGRDVISACMKYREDSQQAFEQTDATHWQFDLKQLIKLILTSSGVARVYDSGLCTYAQPELFYSYRRDGATGRTASLIWME